VAENASETGTPKVWKFAISCYEPIDFVSGGIGTYTRLLLALLQSENRNVILFTAHPPGSEVRALLKHVTFVTVSSDPIFRNRSLNRVGDALDCYSFHLAQRLMSFYRAGHRFQFFEFPDYGAEGYYALRLVKAGVLNIGRSAVRLHSPDLMLAKDNLRPIDDYTEELRERILRELFVYRAASAVLYGGNQMLERIQDDCRHFCVNVTDHAIQIDHPYPGFEPSVPRPNKRTGLHVGFIGRLETRKGILRFFETIAGSPASIYIIKRNDIHFHLVGRDVRDYGGGSIKEQVKEAVSAAGIQGRVHFYGNIKQSELSKHILPSLDAFIFPSIFENYPNALLEILGTEKPTLVSNRGCMPYVARNMPQVSNYDPLLPGAGESICEFLSKAGVDVAVSRRYDDIAAENNASIVRRYLDLPSDSPRAAVVKSLGCSFVVPHFNSSATLERCISSICAVRQEEDEIVVVDDCSCEQERDKAESICRRRNIQFMALAHNAGPSAARNVGARASSTELIQFVDADDYLDRSGYKIVREFLERNPDVHMAYGMMSCFGRQDHLWMPRDASPMTCLEENFTHSGVLIRKSAFDAVGGFDEAMRTHFEDWQFNCKFALAGLVGQVVPVVSLHVLMQPESRSKLNPHLEELSRKQVISLSTWQGTVPGRLAGELSAVAGIYHARAVRASSPRMPPYLRPLHRFVNGMSEKSPLLFKLARLTWRGIARVDADQRSVH
jgi:glycosyltransferase involved in cell wall biosynthesis/GT2 family glycosyltransferase